MNIIANTLSGKPRAGTYRKLRLGILIFALWGITGCQDDFLSVKPDKKKVVPATLEDFQALLASTTILNQSAPSLGIVSSDDLYISYNDWMSASDVVYRNAYIWNKDIFGGEIGNDWYFPYTMVLYANIVLEGVKKSGHEPTNESAWNNVRGAALFFRAYAFYELSQLFAAPYNEKTAETDLGICLRLSPDPNEISTRATVKETYEQITGDLKSACSLLTIVPTYKTSPSSCAAYALLARVYLTMGNYDAAERYADSCLQLNSTLLDYNKIDSTIKNPFRRFNDEVIWHGTAMGIRMLFPSTCKVNPELYSLYTENDLRKELFFKKENDNLYSFRGSYDGSVSLFQGLAVDEIYLIQAECLTRNNKLGEGLDKLNTFLRKRYDSSSFAPIKAATKEQALTRILNERRKELIFRGTRWADLRRLNLESELSTTISRVWDEKTFKLTPRDPRYTLPIPEAVITMSGIQQNER